MGGKMFKLDTCDQVFFPQRTQLSMRKCKKCQKCLFVNSVQSFLKRNWKHNFLGELYTCLPVYSGRHSWTVRTAASRCWPGPWLGQSSSHILRTSSWMEPVSGGCLRYEGWSPYSKHKHTHQRPCHCFYFVSRDKAIAFLIFQLFSVTSLSWYLIKLL